MDAARQLFTLVFLHALADFSLQSKYMADGKNSQQPIPGHPWYIILLAHAVIHGGFVYFATGSLAFGIAETAVHFLIDDRKSRGKFGYVVDQALHVGCKVLWVALPHLSWLFMDFLFPIPAFAEILDVSSV